MLGGGWGGSILCILEKGKEEELIPRIQELCDKRLGRENSCDVLVVKEAGSGARAYCRVCFTLNKQRIEY